MADSFRVGLTKDLAGTGGRTAFDDIGLGVLGAPPDIAWEWLEDADELPPETAGDFDALLVLKPQVTARTLAGAQRLSIIARFGVGYDNIDVNACTESGVLLTITPDGVP